MKEPDFPFVFLGQMNHGQNLGCLDKHILMPQDYGDISDWKEHFDYLLQAFQDERYIYIDDKLYSLFIVQDIFLM
ncbi:glycoside hydrolase family 99-like domain-containing protein [Bacillus thuringiensis]|uniref:glycoside hydrolase family 99-like domain-containing protein n=1 Tax=Bacillus thuringiensis TaxID=1428 RepID=UPI0024136DED|nr:glycoside hydrolase family 99-like domain-containing protein [Bacillus thuringiensis]